MDKIYFSNWQPFCSDLLNDRLVNAAWCQCLLYFCSNTGPKSLKEASRSEGLQIFSPAKLVTNALRLAISLV